jgi:tellurite methyltransferase
MNQNIKSAEYWNSYYAETKSIKPPVPSQFAAFVMQELSSSRISVVDIGCGNGRDTFFFSKYAESCLGLDGSEAVIKLCIENGASHAVDNVEFKKCIIGTADFEVIIGDRIRPSNELVLYYSRFFLHAIDEVMQDALLNSLLKIMKPKDIFAVEFRTIKDSSLEKVTSAHYRRYIDPLAFYNESVRVGFNVDYFIDGFGYAKYKKDDAHVARFFLSKK